MQRLVLSGDHALLDQLRHPSGDYLGLHAQVVLVAQESGHRGGHGADPDLNGVPVIDQFRRNQRADDLGDHVLFVRARCHWHGPRCLLGITHPVDL